MKTWEGKSEAEKNVVASKERKNEKTENWKTFFIHFLGEQQEIVFNAKGKKRFFSSQ